MSSLTTNDLDATVAPEENRKKKAMEVGKNVKKHVFGKTMQFVENIEKYTTSSELPTRCWGRVKDISKIFSLRTGPNYSYLNRTKGPAPPSLYEAVRGPGGGRVPPCERSAKALLSHASA